MSNYIQIHLHVVYFDKTEIDIDKYVEIVDRVMPLNRSPEYAEDSQGHIFWWFLASNSTFFKNIEGKYEGIEIRFGEGKSAHTNRDFKSTIICLKDFILKKKEHTFIIADEYDDFNSLSSETVEFQNATWKS